jgi:hypothetical protein
MARTKGRTGTQQRYASLASFYEADVRRLDSREVDVGLWWRQDPHGPLHRAAWVVRTGELYLVRLGPPSEGGGEVEVLARTDSRERLEEVLRGWQERCGEPRSLPWLRQRAARLRERVTRERMRGGQRPAPSGRPLPGPV